MQTLKKNQKTQKVISGKVSHAIIPMVPMPFFTSFIFAKKLN